MRWPAHYLSPWTTTSVRSTSQQTPLASPRVRLGPHTGPIRTRTLNQPSGLAGDKAGLLVAEPSPPTQAKRVRPTVPVPARRHRRIASHPQATTPSLQGTGHGRAVRACTCAAVPPNCPSRSVGTHLATQPFGSFVPCRVKRSSSSRVAR